MKKRMSGFSGKTSGLINSYDLKKFRFKLLYWSMFLFLIIVTVICLFPSVWIFLSGFKEREEFYTSGLFPKTIRLSKLVDVWNMLNFWKYYLNTLVIMAGDLVFCIVFNGLTGYIISRIRPKGTKLLITIIFWTMLLPTTVNMIPLYMSFVKVPIFGINITNTYIPMWLMSGANAFYILLFRSFFDSISMSYIEAARIDGCTTLGIFARIILPLSKPIIMVVSIFTVTGSWGNFLWPYLVVHNPEMRPITVQLFELRRIVADDAYMLVLLFTIIPPAILYLIFSRHIMGGVDIGGVKE